MPPAGRRSPAARGSGRPVARPAAGHAGPWAGSRWVCVCGERLLTHGETNTECWSETAKVEMEMDPFHSMIV